VTPPYILLTGFAPFGGERINPSWLVAQQLHAQAFDHVLGDAHVHAMCLPTEFGASLLALKRAIRAHQPQLVLCLGQAGGRADLTVERVAINVDDARIPDNAGQQPIDQAVVPRAPAAYFSTLPIKAMVLAMQDAGLPAAVSQTAGTFVCNHVFFGLMHALRRRPGVRAGFMHVPWLPEQRQRPHLPLPDMVRGVRVALQAALGTAQDIGVTGGTES
jgi:pyroglutamyl-peptidase